MPEDSSQSSPSSQTVDCAFTRQGLPCKPCKWFYNGTCKAGNDCPFCHVHQADRIDKKERRARKDQKALELMLPDAEMDSLLQYERMTLEAMGEEAAGAKALCHELRQAYVAHMSEKKGRIGNAKLLVERSLGFFNRSTDGFFRSSRECSLWHEPPDVVKLLHGEIKKRICSAESSDIISGWLSVVEEMTRLMSCLTEATRGPGDADDDELEELLHEFNNIVMQTGTHVQAKKTLQEMFL